MIDSDLNPNRYSDAWRRYRYRDSIPLLVFCAFAFVAVCIGSALHSLAERQRFTWVLTALTVVGSVWASAWRTRAKAKLVCPRCGELFFGSSSTGRRAWTSSFRTSPYKCAHCSLQFGAQFDDDDKALGPNRSRPVRVHAFSFIFAIAAGWASSIWIVRSLFIPSPWEALERRASVIDWALVLMEFLFVCFLLANAWRNRKLVQLLKCTFREVVLSAAFICFYAACVMFLMVTSGVHRELSTQGWSFAVWWNSREFGSAIMIAGWTIMAMLVWGATCEMLRIGHKMCAEEKRARKAERGEP